ncbi:hypothetical protein [Saccharophagus sp. K07]|uniref:hypothetical protein n=1 Tax=Saccharophagus sp. K07 TaxID=2283636 RepID=UPI001652AA27|nr:hypothetical protein [Saccharophagus sp. K07]
MPSKIVTLASPELEDEELLELEVDDEEPDADDEALEDELDEEGLVEGFGSSLLQAIKSRDESKINGVIKPFFIIISLYRTLRAPVKKSTKIRVDGGKFALPFSKVGLI